MGLTYTEKLDKRVKKREINKLKETEKFDESQKFIEVNEAPRAMGWPELDDGRV